MEEKRPKVKILVGYHKPAQLLKSDIFEPIHLGRALATEASKDGNMSEDDYQWMLDNMIGDDTGDNISKENLFLNELTAFYWAWKNYDKLGDPEYFGFMHYRRHLCFDEHNIEKTDKYGLLYFNELNEEYIKKYKLKDNIVETLVVEYDITVAEKTDLIKLGTKTSYLHYKTSDPKLHTEDLDNVLEILLKKYPEYRQAKNEYLNSKYAYFTNVFIMKKELFFEYCKWLFDIIFEAKRTIDLNNYNIQEIRALAYIAEWLFGIFLTYKKQNPNIKVCELKRTFIRNTDINIIPNKNKENEIPIIFSVDDNYIPYLGVSIKTLIENSSKDNNYRIFILDDGISKISKDKIKLLEQENIKIDFINVLSYIKNYDKNIFHLCEHFSIATYYRFFIPEIFKNYDKILYCDCDAIFLDDVAKAFEDDLEDNILGVVHDTEVIREIFSEKDKYFKEKLKLENPMNYFQAGFLLMNIKKMIDINFTNICIEKLQEIKTPRYVDQDILNSAFEDKVKFLDGVWNVENHLKIWRINLINELPYQIYQEYENNLRNAKYLHFSGAIKPWQDPSSFNAHLWWKYARMTPFCEEIIYRNTRTIIPPTSILVESKFYKNFLQRIFSIKNDKTRPDKIYKVLTILGIKFKFKKRKK